MLNTGYPEHVLQFFKMSDIDPRELIILFDDLTRDLRPALNDHIRSTRYKGLHQLYNTVRTQRVAQEDHTFEVQVKLQKAKDVIKTLFNHLNQKYLSELRKDEDKPAEFMYSTYSHNYEVIKKEERKLLKDIVPFVQTALVRLYIEDDEDGRDKIF